jgi:TonB-linked SusC/RagA family outer membrane protein
MKQKEPNNLYRSKSHLKLLVLIPLLGILPNNEILANIVTLKATEKLNPVLQKTVKGIVRDADGLPLPGISILEKGTKNGTSTNEKGQFSIAVKGPDAVLIVSSIGFLQKEVTLKGNNVTIIMESDKKALEEVVVVGYGTQKKANLTGAVSQIDSKMLENRPTTNLGQALQGLIPNFNVNIANGNPKTGATYNLRGATSFYKDVDDANKIKTSNGSPFILVDGVEMDPNMLNPDDIESVTVLKDAASAAIYGARGAFGVVLIKTKSGKGGKTKVTYSNSFQMSSPTTVPDILDAYTIQDAVVKALQMENGSVSNEIAKLEKIKEYMDDPINNEPYYYTDATKKNIIWRGNVNPYKETLLKSSPMQKHSLSLSGGNENTSFYGSFGYQDQDGLYKINTDNLKRYNALLNVSSKGNDWFKMDFKTAYNNSTYIEPVSPAGKGGWWVAMSQEPGRNVNMPMLVPASLNAPFKYTDNILSFMDYGSSVDENKANILLAASPTINFTKDWALKGDLSYLSNSSIKKTILPYMQRMETVVGSATSTQTDPGYVERYNYNSNKYTINVYTDYTKTIGGKHNFHGLVGFNKEWYTEQDATATRTAMNPNVPTLGQAQGVMTVADSENHWAVQGLFYRFAYNYEGKYLLESNGRSDGTSRFQADRRFKFFPSVSAGWRVTEESFAKSIKPYINDLKLRASYGSLGNQNVTGFYPYILQYGTTAQISYLMNGVRPVGITPAGLVDPDFTWETATTIDFGFDLSAFNHFEINFDWYRRRTTDILIDGLKLPAVLGTNSPQVNSGTMDTKGWELGVKYKNTTSYGLNYDFAATLSDAQSEVVKFANNPNNLITDALLYEGQKIGEIWGYETYGIFQSQDEINNAPTQKLISSGLWFPGDVRYKDLDGNNEITPGNSTLGNTGDKEIIGNNTPRYQFGLNSNFSYKNFDLNIFMQGVGKRDLWINNNLYWGAGSTGTWETYNNSWTSERTDAFYPAYKNAGRNRQVQTRYLANGAYLRLKNLAVGYSIPKSLTDKIKLQRVRVSASAYNLFEFKSVPKTFDPELVGMNYPIIRSFAFGIQATF